MERLKDFSFILFRCIFWNRTIFEAVPVMDFFWDSSKSAFKQWCYMHLFNSKNHIFDKYCPRNLYWQFLHCKQWTSMRRGYAVTAVIYVVYSRSASGSRGMSSSYVPIWPKRDKKKRKKENVRKRQKNKNSIKYQECPKFWKSPFLKSSNTKQVKCKKWFGCF